MVMDGKGCNISNNPNLEDLEKLVESSLIQYHLAPSSQFENIKKIGQDIVVEPYKETLLRDIQVKSSQFYKFLIQSRFAMCYIMYFINSYQEYIIVSSTKKLLLLK